MSNECNQINIIIDNDKGVDVTIPEEKGIGLEFDNSYTGGSYPPLSEKPSINDVVLIGNKTSADIHVQHEMDTITEQQIDNIIYGG